MRGKVAILVLSLVLLFFACQREKNVNQESSIMYVPSELSLLMRDMHDTLSVWKNDILAGDTIFIYPKYFESLHSAEATNPDEINDAFYVLASSFEHSIYRFKENQDIESYNLVINSCVTCHRNYCQGPISKIENLLVK